jgi:hypothetical protein
MFVNIGSTCHFVQIALPVGYAYQVHPVNTYVIGYVFLQLERMQRGHEPVADYAVTGITK